MLSSMAYSQANYIIGKMSDELRKKIPIEIIEFIKSNDNKQYTIDENNIKNMKLHGDTKKILSVIYTDYLATETEKKIIKNKERMIELQQEKNKENKYEVDIFNNKEKNTINTQNETTTMIIRKKEKWYKKIFNKIKRIFKL